MRSDDSFRRRVWACPFCRQVFPGKKGASKHAATHTKGEPMEPMAYLIPEGTRNEWHQRMDALIESEGVDAALGQAFADGMAFVCSETGHPRQKSGDLACFCGVEAVA